MTLLWLILWKAIYLPRKLKSAFSELDFIKAMRDEKLNLRLYVESLFNDTTSTNYEYYCLWKLRLVSKWTVTLSLHLCDKVFREIAGE